MNNFFPAIIALLCIVYPLHAQEIAFANEKNGTGSNRSELDFVSIQRTSFSPSGIYSVPDEEVFHKQDYESGRAENKFLTKPFKIGLYAEPLGFLQFGPKIGVEMTIISRIVIDHHVRFSSEGLIMPLVLEEEEGKPDDLEGMAFCIGFKYLNPSQIGGFYIGILGEIGKTRTLFDKDGEEEWRGEALQLGSYVSLGYKFEFPSGIFIRTGGQLGIVSIFVNEWYYTSDTTTVFEEDPLIIPGGMLEVCLGIQF
ncbi:MAG: hypothetical protein JXB24_00855 [Bacteroidales bacterium]|nr:hypothetical protein [Bacteroidales bacterium]